MHAFFKRKRERQAPPVPPSESNGNAADSLSSSADSLTHESMSVRERFAAVFGDYWLLNFVVPQVWFPNRLTPHYRQLLMDAYMKEM